MKWDLLAIYKYWNMKGIHVFKVLQLANESSYMHGFHTTVFKPTSYLQYHPQYKKPETTFPTILDGLLPSLTLDWLYQVNLTMGGDGGGGRARLYFK